MESIDELLAIVPSLFTETAEMLAAETGVIRRQRQFSGATLVQTLIFGWLEHADATLGQLTQVAALRGVVVTPQALEQRFTPALVTCLERFLAVAVASLADGVGGEPVAIPLLHRFSGIWLLDSTTISLPDALAGRWPGCGGRQPGAGTAALKVTVQLDLLRGRFAPPDLSAGRLQDRASAGQQAVLPPESLRLSDLGYFTLSVLRQIAADGSFFLTRVPVNVVVDTCDGERIADLPRWLAHQATAEGTVDVPILLGATEHLPVRLLAERVPDRVAAERRRRIHQRAKKKGTRVSKAALARADWTLFVTNAPAERLRGAEARCLYHARWQIELLFKRWKQEGHLDRWRSANPHRILSEVYAKLIGLILQQRLLWLSDWSRPHKSLRRAGGAIRDHIRAIAAAFDDRGALRQALVQLTRCLQAATTTNRSRQRRSTADRLLAIALEA
ncbi:MAG TPA: IS4 family transposase [Nitrolancea sp.]|jgi:hypothetical protein|nr:IS4 family transposase [Nitrolancea sp.]